MSEQVEHVTEPALERFVFFSDAVFAIAITLLVIEIKVPPVASGVGEAAWEGVLVHLWPSFFAFILTFMVVGSVWSAHHAVFRLVSKFTDDLIFPNLMLLMTVALVPFSSALLSERTIAPAPYAFYSVTLLVVGLAKVWVTGIALRPTLVSAARLAENRDRRQADVLADTRGGRGGAGAGLRIPGWNNLAMMLIPAGRRLPFCGMKTSLRATLPRRRADGRRRGAVPAVRPRLSRAPWSPCRRAPAPYSARRKARRASPARRSRR